MARTFDFYKDFRSDAFQKNWTLLIKQWNSKADDENKLIQAKDYDGLRKLTLSLANNAGVQEALAQTVLFFDEVSSCVDNSLCDRNAAAALFADPAGQIVSSYGYYFVEVQKMNKLYAVGIFEIRNLEKTWSIF